MDNKTLRKLFIELQDVKRVLYKMDRVLGCRSDFSVPKVFYEVSTMDQMTYNACSSLENLYT